MDKVDEVSAAPPEAALSASEEVNEATLYSSMLVGLAQSADHVCPTFMDYPANPPTMPIKPLANCPMMVLS